MKPVSEPLALACSRLLSLATNSVPARAPALRFWVWLSHEEQLSVVGTGEVSCFLKSTAGTGLTIRSSRARFAASALAGYDLTIANAAQRPGLAQALGAAMNFSHFTFLLLLLLAGCAATDAPTATKASLGELKKACPVTVREVLANGSVSRNEIIRPEHVLSIEPGPNGDAEDMSLQVTLDTVGSQRMHTYTSEKVGGQLATFCGETEVSRATIREPFSTRFIIQMPIVPSGT